MSHPSARPGWWCRLSIPWLWLIVAIISWRHPGDEYELFVIANGLPSALLSVLFFGTSGPIAYAFTKLVACSFVAMFVLSWAMDRLRVWLAVFIPLYALGSVGLVLWALSDFESLQRAISKNGSLTAYISAASNLSLFVSGVLCVLIFGAGRLAVRWSAKPVAT